MRVPVVPFSVRRVMFRRVIHLCDIENRPGHDAECRAILRRRFLQDRNMAFENRNIPLRALAHSLAAFALLAGATFAAAADWPARPIRIAAPHATGGGPPLRPPSGA